MYKISRFFAVNGAAWCLYDIFFLPLNKFENKLLEMNNYKVA